MRDEGNLVLYAIGLNIVSSVAFQAFVILSNHARC